MSFQQRLFAILFASGMVFAAPSPHIGMVNNDDIRDVGAVYSQPGYASESTFLFMDKKMPKCNTFNNGTVWSIMICVESIECDFWKDNDCGAMPNEQAVFTVGCGDIHALPLDLAGTYGSYRCHEADPNNQQSSGTARLKTTPHDPHNNLLGQLGFSTKTSTLT